MSILLAEIVDSFVHAASHDISEAFDRLKFIIL